MVKKLILCLSVMIFFISCRTMQNVKTRQVTQQEYTVDTEEVFEPGKVICSEVSFEEGSQNTITLTYKQYYDKVRLEKRHTVDVVYEETSYDEYALIFYSHSDTKKQEIQRIPVKTEVLRRTVLEKDVPDKTETLEIKAGEKVTVSVVDIRVSTMTVSGKTTVVSKTPIEREAFSTEIKKDGTFTFDEQMYETMLQTAREGKSGNEFPISIVWSRETKKSDDSPWWKIDIGSIPYIATVLSETEKKSLMWSSSEITEKDTVEVYRKKQNQLAAFNKDLRYSFQKSVLWEIIEKNYSVMTKVLNQKQYNEYKKAPFFVVQGEIKEYDDSIASVSLWGVARPAIQNTETYLMKGSQFDNVNIIILMAEKPDNPFMYFADKLYFVQSLAGTNVYGGKVPIYSYSRIPPTAQKRAAEEYDRLNGLYKSIEGEYKKLKSDIFP